MIRAAILVLAIAATGLAGCDLTMTRQARSKADRSTELWPAGPSIAAAPDGTVEAGAPTLAAIAARPPMSQALVERGRDRYDVYCLPCHGVRGQGDGPVVQRGFPRPPSYDLARLRAAPAQHFYDVAGNGFGVMFGYGDRLTPRDRWAVAAYIRALQLADAPGAAS